MVSDNEMPVFVEALSANEIDSDSDLVYALPTSVLSVNIVNSDSGITVSLASDAISASCMDSEIY